MGAGGTHTVEDAMANITGTGAPETLNGTGGDDWIQGLGGDDTIFGLSGNDIIDGGIGNDTMTGGIGDDTYYVNNGLDVVIENAAEGYDTVRATANYKLSDNVERLFLQEGAGAINGGGNDLDNRLYGNSASNVLVGNGGDDFLDGLGGADTMEGGIGNDTYVVDNVGDVVKESVQGGIDKVWSSVSYTLAASVENLNLTGVAAVNGTGNSLDNYISGNGAANVLNGGGGNDILDGMAGADTLIGGLGDDKFYVDNAGDAVIENAGEGNDWVGASVNFTIGANIESLGLLGSAVFGTGNGLDNQIVGNSLNNILSGGDGDDFLDGKAGTDALFGGAGNDNYEVDNVGDQVSENANEGYYDEVWAKVSYTLGANVEALYLYDVAGATSATGNGQSNWLYGNALDNVIDGGAGSDIMYGKGGNDTFLVDDKYDAVFENAGEGSDWIWSSISYNLGANLENIELLGNAAINSNGNALDNIMTGNAGANTLDGGDGADEIHGHGDNDYVYGGAGDDELFGEAGNDKLIGTIGVDVMTGGIGADIFEFRTPQDSGYLLLAPADQITDFSAAEGDKIDLFQIDANSIAAGDQAFSFIGNNNAFFGQAGQLRFNGGFLEGDLDGDATADFRIQVNAPSLVAADFVL
jgi:Ca2+-binding RTX toxin-like protein